jgi:transcription elongation factor Elf1
MEITACPICGSKNIRIGTLGDGIISGLSSWKEVCRDCGYQGASLLFESETEYKKFVDALSPQKKQSVEQTEDASEENQEEESDEQIKENKELLDFLDETEKTPRYVKKNYLFEFALAAVLSIVFFIILFGSSYISVNNGIFSQNDSLTIILYVLGSFVGVLIFFFLMIVFVEMIYRSVNGKEKK